MWTCPGISLGFQNHIAHWGSSFFIPTSQDDRCNQTNWQRNPGTGVADKNGEFSYFWEFHLGEYRTFITCVLSQVQTFFEASHVSQDPVWKEWGRDLRLSTRHGKVVTWSKGVGWGRLGFTLGREGNQLGTSFSLGFHRGKLQGKRQTGLHQAPPPPGLKLKVHMMVLLWWDLPAVHLFYLKMASNAFRVHVVQSGR